MVICFKQYSKQIVHLIDNYSKSNLHTIFEINCHVKFWQWVDLPFHSKNLTGSLPSENRIYIYIRVIFMSHELTSNKRYIVFMLQLCVCVCVAFLCVVSLPILISMWIRYQIQ